MPVQIGDGKVFDALHDRFGVGDYCEELTEKPWHQWRMGEISKIKAVRERRRVSPIELIETIAYCGENGIYIRHHMDLYEHLGAAREWTKRRDVEREYAGLADELRAAIEHEMAQPGSEWLDRLLRASSVNGQKEVLDLWKQRTSR